MSQMFILPELQQVQTMRKYYQWQSKIYDATRWSFLFGRKKVLKMLPLDKHGQWQILEIGCGTGANLAFLAKQYPNSKLYGIDVSADMLQIASQKLKPFKKRVSLEEGAYPIDPLAMEEHFDVILFSYSLTMINPKWDILIRQAMHDLRPGGFIAAVDFHDSPIPLFKKHMKNNHVRMDGHLLPVLQDLSAPVYQAVKNVYGGTWKYFMWIGRKSNQ